MEFSINAVEFKVKLWNMLFSVSMISKWLKQGLFFFGGGSDRKDFKVMSGSDWTLLTSLKHCKCADKGNWQSEWFIFVSSLSGQRHILRPIILFLSFLVCMPFISMASQCTVGIAAVLAPCARQRERSVSTPSIPHSDEWEILTICGCVSQHLVKN